MTEFAKKVINGLNETGMTQKELAEESFSTEVTISRILNGVSEPNRKTSFNIKSALNKKGYNWE